MKKTILALLLGLCALSSYAYMYDWNELPMIPKGYINQDEESPYNAFLYEKNVTIFGKQYPLIIRNIKLSRYWFECDIVIDNYVGHYNEEELTKKLDGIHLYHEPYKNQEEDYDFDEIEKKIF